jgi:hypothetical protein
VLGAACGKWPDDGKEHAGATVEAGPEEPAVVPLAEQNTEWPDLLIQVIELKRSGTNVMELSLAFVHTSQSGEPFRFGDRFAADESTSDSVSGIHLVDLEGQKKYFVLSDGEGRPLCSTGLEPVPPGGRRVAWARFVAPSPGTAELAVQIPSVPLIRGIPLT